MKERLYKSPENGSLTVEASITLPLFILFFTSLYILFSAMAAELRIQSAISKCGKNIAACYFAVSELEDKSEAASVLKGSVGGTLLIYGVSETLVRKQVEAELGSVFTGSRLIKNGASGISYLGSRYDSGSGNIIICASWQIQIPFLSTAGISLRLSRQSVHRAWTGKEIQGVTNEQTVYIAENGTVYHTSLACTYLNLSISEVSYDSLKSRKNKQGQQYRACELCSDLSGDSVFITNYGECYHFNVHCSGLKRSIRQVPLSQTGLSECRRCRKREESR